MDEIVDCLGSGVGMIFQERPTALSESLRLILIVVLVSLILCRSAAPSVSSPAPLALCLFVSGRGFTFFVLCHLSTGSSETIRIKYQCVMCDIICFIPVRRSSSKRQQGIRVSDPI